MQRGRPIARATACRQAQGMPSMRGCLQIGLGRGTHLRAVQGLALFRAAGGLVMIEKIGMIAAFALGVLLGVVLLA